MRQTVTVIKVGQRWTVIRADGGWPEGQPTQEGRAMKTTTEREKEAFVYGYISGEHGHLSSPRQVAIQYPSFTDGEVTCYIHGEMDGWRGDLFRIELGGMGALLAARRVS